MALLQQTRYLGISTPLGPDVLLLTGFTGREGISQLSSFQLEMISENNDIQAKQLVGKRVTISVRLADDSQRHFDGFVSRFLAGDEDDHGRRSYRAEVVPWLWFLTRTADCRIFQNKSVPEIIQRIFKDLGFSDFEMKLEGSHQPREYCVQYRETDFNFVSRLMEDEGIFYFFRHENCKHVMVIADSMTAYKDCVEKEVTLPRKIGENAFTDHLTSWEHLYEFRPGKWAQTDYNFETPATNLMSTTPSIVKIDGMDKYEVYDYPGEYLKKSDGDALTRIRMEEEESSHDIVNGTSLCKTFTPGGKFKIKLHRSGSEQGRSFVITSICHEATEPLSYETVSAGEAVEFDYRNTFTCIPHDVCYRPARTTRKPFVQGVQTAAVVGPQGEEIFTDKYGRIKVQFHWDREGKRDENSSCWIRVSQVHAGKGWGGIDTPRIGEEVIVDFLEGDADRPIVTGRVYNAANMPPFALPAEMTRSGMKSDTHKGDGYNEISLDDTAGKEQIRIHGQYNMDTRVENDETHSIGKNRKADVGVNESMLVGKNQSLQVGANRAVTVGNNHSETVGANQSVTIGASQNVTVGASQTTTIGTVKTELVGASSNEVIGAMKSTSVGAVYALSVGAAMNAAVGFLQSEEVGLNRKLLVGKKLEVNVGSKIQITCGASKIEMDSSGKILIQGTDVTMQSGAGKVNIDAGGIITIKGPMVKINT